MQQDRYCRSCGQELKPEDQFCAGCGRPVHTTAHVPTPEADVPFPPPQQAEVGPQSQQQQYPHDAQAHSKARGSGLAMLGVFLVLLIVESMQNGTAMTNPGKDFAFRLGYGMPSSIADTLFVAVLAAAGLASLYTFT